MARYFLNKNKLRQILEYLKINVKLIKTYSISTYHLRYKAACYINNHFRVLSATLTCQQCQL